MTDRALTLLSLLFLTISVISMAQGGGKQSRRSVASEKKMATYLFVFFDDKNHSLCMATRRDGYTFSAVNKGHPVIAGDTIADQKGVRDPHIYRGPDGTPCNYVVK